MSLSKLAMANGVNANMVFKWRRELLAGLFDGASDAAPKLLPAASAVEPMAMASAQSAPDAPLCMIEIVIAYALMRCHGNADPALLRTVFQSLRA